MSKPHERKQPSQPSQQSGSAKRKKSNSKPSNARPGAPLRRALDDLSATSSALDETRMSLREEREARQVDRQRNADLIRDLRRQLHKTERELGHSRAHVETERAGRESSEEREVQALKQAEHASRLLKEKEQELEQIRAQKATASKDKTARVEKLEAELAQAQAHVKRTEATHASIRERVVALESELSQARKRTVELTQSRDAERKGRDQAESTIAQLERELTNSSERGEELLGMLNTATRIEHGLQRYADKIEGRVVSSEHLIGEARQRLDRIGNEIDAARRRLALPSQKSRRSADQARANLG